MKKPNREKGSISPVLWFFIFLMVGAWVLWYYTGGPERASSQAGPFMQPVAPLGNGQGYNTIGH